jgi:hypothetical protein
MRSDPRPACTARCPGVESTNAAACYTGPTRAAGRNERHLPVHAALPHCYAFGCCGSRSSHLQTHSRDFPCKAETREARRRMTRAVQPARFNPGHAAYPPGLATGLVPPPPPRAAPGPEPLLSASDGAGLLGARGVCPRTGTVPYYQCPITRLKINRGAAGTCSSLRELVSL